MTGAAWSSWALAPNPWPGVDWAPPFRPRPVTLSEDAFQARLADQMARRTATDALPVGAALLDRLREALLDVAPAFGQSSPWGPAHRRFVHMAVVPYGPAWEAELGGGVWTDGVRIWVAESALHGLMWEQLVEHTRWRVSPRPLGLRAAESLRDPAVPQLGAAQSQRTYVHLKWGALNQALVQAAGVALRPPGTSGRWPLRWGGRTHWSSDRAEVRPDVVPWSQVLAALARVPGALAVCLAQGWDDVHPQEVTDGSDPEVTVPALARLRNRWRQAVAEGLDAQANPHWSAPQARRALWEGALPARWNPWRAMALPHLDAWAAQASQKVLDEQGFVPAAGLELWTAFWAGRRSLPSYRLAARTSRRPPASRPLTWTPAAVEQLWQRCGLKIPRAWRQTVTSLARVIEAGVVPPGSIQFFNALHRQKSDHLQPGFHGQPSFLWSAVWLVGARAGLSCPAKWVPSLLGLRFYHRSMGRRTQWHTHLWARAVREDSALGHALRHSPQVLHGPWFVITWERWQALLDVGAPCVEHEVRNGAMLERALTHGAPVDQVVALWRRCDPAVAWKGQVVSAGRGSASLNHFLRNIQRGPVLEALLAEGLPLSQPMRPGRSVLSLLSWHHLPSRFIPRLVALGASTEGAIAEILDGLQQWRKTNRVLVDILRMLRAGCAWPSDGAIWENMDDLLSKTCGSPARRSRLLDALAHELKLDEDSPAGAQRRQEALAHDPRAGDGPSFVTQWVQGFQAKIQVARLHADLPFEGGASGSGRKRF